MTRYLFSFLLLVAVALFGVVPHAVMAEEAPTASIPCSNEQGVMREHVEAIAYCGTADHSMSAACGVACLGSIATWFPPPDPALMVFRPVAHQMAMSLVLHGRLIETADRPPKSI
ncbi:hypothetical protein [Pseudorhodobacter aquimaris]|uniref:hypothetical protein n=1 Tax=Pseudorhodobacter aquimaris TaxID=687412 RepID=UPI0012ECDD5A|nr:hypothetical protein [Pseudorhodobacter aquimaris]